MATSEEKRRAAEFVARKLTEIRKDEGWLLHASGVDSGTLRTFLRGETFPQEKTRHAIEDALGISRGSISLVARGLIDTRPSEADQDPVVAAIRASALTRANRAKVEGYYFELLDAQGEVGNDGRSAPM